MRREEAYVSLAISIPRISPLLLLHRQMGLPPPVFSTSKNGTHHCWLEAKGGGDHAPLTAAAGIPSSALPAPRGGLCMRATTSPTFWMVPTTNNTRTGRRTGSAPTSMQIGPSSLPYLLSDLRIHNLRRVRVMMPQTGLRLWGPLRVSRFHLPLPDGQIRKCFVRKLLTRIINGVERIEWGRDQLLRRMRLMRVTVRRCPFHVSPIVAMSLSQPDLAPFSSLMKRRQWRKNQMAAAEIDSQHRRLQKRSPPNNIIPTLQITSR